MNEYYDEAVHHLGFQALLGFGLGLLRVVGVPIRGWASIGFGALGFVVWGLFTGLVPTGMGGGQRHRGGVPSHSGT